MRTLYAIVRELGVSFDEIFSDMPTDDGLPAADALFSGGELGAGAGAADVEADTGIVQRGATRRVIELESGVRWEQLTTRNDPEAEFLYAVYRVGAESGPADALVRHTGREFGVVLSGRLAVTVGFEQHVLTSGDSILFDSSVPHRLRNDGTEDVHAIWVVLGRQQR